MKSASILQLSTLGGVLAAHVLALWLLNQQHARQAPITPPRLARMDMIALAPPSRPAASPPATPQPSRPRQAEAKPAPAKPAPKTLPVQTSKMSSETPAPAQAISAPAAAAASDAPKSDGQTVSAGKSQAITEPLARGGYLNNPAPAYPSQSQEDGEAGTVRLRVHVSAQGLPLDVSVQDSSGFPRLDRAALAAVKRWRFIPAKRGDEPIAYTFVVPVEFSLKSIRS
ncbi:energy transducer TonB [Chromobacterium sinusclupearum]|uniref:Energy transducer TonB n=1 Tax=Chromobacterium sinusclupearum TaxID=2077146 RepID=A0A2K4MQB6_9NEIS|nr:energy transducer TonB [Chromobacterium sinusclupearum]POA99294.1 energy transducer TonB [Chromobacterium sinusclupearum]